IHTLVQLIQGRSAPQHQQYIAQYHALERAYHSINSPSHSDKLTPHLEVPSLRNPHSKSLTSYLKVDEQPEHLPHQMAFGIRLVQRTMHPHLSLASIR